MMAPLSVFISITHKIPLCKGIFKTGIPNLAAELGETTDGGRFNHGVPRRYTAEEDLTTKNTKNTKKGAKRGPFAGFRAFRS
jgi:hypothetical protein